MVKKEQEEFFDGVIYAACLLTRLYDQPGMSAEILKEAGLNNWDCSKQEEFEKEILRKINKENIITLRGL